VVFDYLITNGLVVDGTGCPPYRATVAIEDDHVRLFRGEPVGLEGKRTIDAEGQAFAPGFIDFHAHSGLVLLAEPKHEAKVQQGVTSEVIGVDGNSYAPFLSREQLEEFRDINAGLDGAPPIDYDWLTVSQYLGRFDGQTSVNVAYVVGNSPLRMMEIGWQNREATSVELGNMRARLREAMEEGAFGLSTGLDYPPGEYATTSELTDLCRTAQELGGIYHSHIRYTLGDQYLDPLREAIAICRESGAPCHITHLYKSAAMAKRGGAEPILGLLEDAAASGIEVTFDTYPYNYSSTRLCYLLPSWAFDRGRDGVYEILRSPEGRQKIRDQYSRQEAIAWDDMWVTNLRLAEHAELDGRTIAEIARLLGCDPIVAVCELLEREELQPSFISLMDQGYSRAKFIAHPLAMFGSDAMLLGQFPSPRTYGTFPRVLSEFVREERYLSLPEAIHKMTAFPATRLGLKNRGMLRDGYAADVVVFDPATVSSPATRQQPKQMPIGIGFVFVNGRLVVEGGRHTGALPGRALRRGKD